MNDLISRQAAIDAAIEAADDWDGGCSKERERFIRDALEELPSARPEQRWIPCSERLPEENEYVLVCNSQGTMRVCYYHTDYTFYPTEYEDLNETGWYDEVGDALYPEPIAWMPLPEPYREERTEE